MSCQWVGTPELSLDHTKVDVCVHGSCTGSVFLSSHCSVALLPFPNPQRTTSGGIAFICRYGRLCVDDGVISLAAVDNCGMCMEAFENINVTSGAPSSFYSRLQGYLRPSDVCIDVLEDFRVCQCNMG